MHSFAGCRLLFCLAVLAAIGTFTVMPAGAGASGYAGGLPTPPASSTASITETPFNEWPYMHGLTSDAAGNVWMATEYPGQIVRVNSGGDITRFPVDGSPTSVAVGPDGNVWFTNGGVITKMTPDGQMTNFQAPSSVFSITAGPGGLWFTMPYYGVGRITTAGEITEYPLWDKLTFNERPGSSDFAANTITAGPDGNVWYTSVSGYIVRVTPSGQATSFPVPIVVGSNRRGGSVPESITSGPDGNLWFTDLGANEVGKADPAGNITMFRIPTDSSYPGDITTGPDGNLWFTAGYMNRIDRVTTAGVITEVHAATPLSFPNGIAAAGGKIWFGEYPLFPVPSLASFDPATVAPPPPPCLVVTQDTTLTKDVGPCRGDGILVTANNLTLNLNGHKVVGANRRLGDFAGVHLKGVSGVDVVGGNGAAMGTVSGFDAGVYVDMSSNNTVHHLNLVDNIGATDWASWLGDGVAVMHGSGNRISDNEINHDGMYDGVSLLGVASDDNTVQSNTVENITDGTDDPNLQALLSYYASPAEGIVTNPFLESVNPLRGSSLYRNTIAGNTVRNNLNSGISNVSNVDASIKNNVVSNSGLPPGRYGYFPGNGIGISNLQMAVASTNDQVAGNHITGSLVNGLEVDSQGNTLTRNVATGNGDPTFSYQHFDLADYSGGYGPPGSCTTNVWSFNTWGDGGTFPDCVTAGPGTGPKSSATALTGRQPPSNPNMTPRGRPFDPTQVKPRPRPKSK